MTQSRIRNWSLPALVTSALFSDGRVDRVIEGPAQIVDAIPDCMDADLA